MEIKYNGVDYKSLTQMAESNTQNSEFVTAFKEAGKTILDNSVDIFFKPDREMTDAKKSVQDLKDLETAMKACYNNTRKIQDEEYAKKEDEARKSAGRYENLDISFDRRLENLSGVARFIKDLHTVLPLYTCIAMVPGPMSVSVKNFAKEMMEGNYSDRSSSSSSSSSRGAAASYSHNDARGNISGGLLFKVLDGTYVDRGNSSSASSMSSDSSSSSQNNVNANVSYQKITSDERVLPVIMDLSSRLDEIELSNRPCAKIKPSFSPSNDNNLVAPAHVWLPQTGTSRYQ